MSFNANTTVAAYVSLYATTDFSSLSWLEKRWAAWYIMIGNPALATGLLAVIVHEIAYFGRCIPFIIIDAIPYFNKWKLQPHKTFTPAQQWECTKLVLWNHFTMQLTSLVIAHALSGWTGVKTYEVPITPWSKMALQCFLFFVYDDIFHYIAHRTLHTPYLYKRLHKVHHKYSAPFGLAAEYGHPVEVFGLSSGAVIGPFTHSLVTGDVHIFTIFLFISLRLWQAVDAHSGYDFPWSLHNIVPFWAGAEHHDFHHMAFTNNYSSSFRWWDRIMGTDKKYQAYRARMREAKRNLGSADGGSEKLALYEQKLLAEVEDKGLKAEAELVGEDSKTD